MATRPASVRDAGRDLLLGGSCVGCGAPGRLLCPGCDATLPRHGVLAWPRPAPPGLVPPYAAGAYDGLLKVLVNQHKEHAALALAGPLGRMLGDVVHDLLVPPRDGPAREVQLVPVPSRRAVVRARGHDPLLRVARETARRLRRRGVDARVRQLLASSGAVRDQSTLGAEERSLNLEGSMRCRPGARAEPGTLLVVDDVLTTGSTAREAQRALEDHGLRVTAVATVAATQRWGGATRRQETTGSLPFPGQGV